MKKGSQLKINSHYVIRPLPGPGADRRARILGLVAGAILVFPPLAPKAFADPAQGGSDASAAKPHLTGSGNIAMTSNYLFRGISQTKGSPAIQGGFDLNHDSGLYVGTWGSNVNFGATTPHMELDLYGGYTYAFSDSISLSAGALHYTYLTAATLNTIEFPVKLALGDFKIGYAYSPKWLGTGGYGGYASLSWSHAIGASFSLAAATGYSHFSSAAPYHGYTDFKLGLSRPLFGFTADLSGTTVNRPQFGGDDDPKAVFTLSKAL